VAFRNFYLTDWHSNCGNGSVTDDSGYSWLYSYSFYSVPAVMANGNNNGWRNEMASVNSIQLAAQRIVAI